MAGPAVLAVVKPLHREILFRLGVERHHLEHSRMAHVAAHSQVGRMRVVAEQHGRNGLGVNNVSAVELSGERRNWRNLNKTFLGDLRRQLLGWRNLKKERILRYLESAHALLDRIPDSPGTTTAAPGGLKPCPAS